MNAHSGIGLGFRVAVRGPAWIAVSGRQKFVVVLVRNDPLGCHSWRCDQGQGAGIFGERCTRS